MKSVAITVGCGKNSLVRRNGKEVVGARRARERQLSLELGVWCGGCAADRFYHSGRSC